MNQVQFYFQSLLGQQVIFTLPQEDAISGTLIECADGFFLVEGADGTRVALNQNLILMVSPVLEAAVTTTQEHHDEPRINTSGVPFDGHGYGPDSPNGTFGG